jgi:DNA-binding Lrp family transcriptional regulator
VESAQQITPHKTVGSTSCAASTCHGGIQPWEGSNILGNEFITWSRLDKHRKAQEALQSKQAKAIAQKLGLEKPASQTPACLSCHAQNPMLNTPVSGEGVNCESCHGNATKWLSSHKNSSHQDNIKNGMYPTNNPAAQAKLCLSCHLGTTEQFVTHRMMAAGHPRLNFELTTFTAIQPPHFTIDSDWRKRKGEYSPIKSWAIGQVIASQFILNSFADPKLGHDGIFPELVVFDCHACHRQMSEKRGAPRWDMGPGRLHLNDSHFLMLSAILKVGAPRELPEFTKQISNLQNAISADHGAAGMAPDIMAKAIAQSLEKYIPIINQLALDNKQLKSIFLAMVEESAKGQYSDPSGAEQAYMAIANLASQLVKSGALHAAGKVNGVLADMRKNLSDDEHYKADVFASQLDNLKNILLVSR